MNRWENLKLYARKFATWSPADIFYNISPTSSDVYTIFLRKIQRSSLKFLFTSVMLTGVLLDVLTIIYLLQPFWETYVTSKRISVFILLSAVNVVHHLLFLLLRNTKAYTGKYQILVSTGSYFILYFLINQFRALNHPQAPVQVWITLGLLEMLVAVFYFQGSFVYSMLLWTITAIWISSGDSVAFTLQVYQFLTAYKHLYHCVK